MSTFPAPTIVAVNPLIWSTDVFELVTVTERFDDELMSRRKSPSPYVRDDKGSNLITCVCKKFATRFTSAYTLNEYVVDVDTCTPPCVQLMKIKPGSAVACNSARSP